MRRSQTLFLLTFISGSLLSIVIHLITQSTELSTFFMHPTPTKFVEIFIHNLKIYLVFYLPFWRYIHFTYSFFIIFFSIGLAFSHLGLFVTLKQLVHLPLELYALCIPVGFKYREFNFIKLIHTNILGIFLLLFASLIEFYI